MKNIVIAALLAAAVAIGAPACAADPPPPVPAPSGSVDAFIDIYLGAVTGSELPAPGVYRPTNPLEEMLGGQ
jgi:hypothetical protein